MQCAYCGKQADSAKWLASLCQTCEETLIGIVLAITYCDTIKLSDYILLVPDNDDVDDSNTYRIND